MAAIKWYHKIFIVILVIVACWKISKMKFWGRKDAKTAPLPVQREPERVTVIREIREVPAPATQPQPPSPYPWGTNVWPVTSPSYPQCGESYGNGGVTYQQPPEPAAVQASGVVHFGDDAMARYRGGY